jgi:hypothetical protein
MMRKRKRRRSGGHQRLSLSCRHLLRRRNGRCDPLKGGARPRSSADAPSARRGPRSRIGLRASLQAILAAIGASPGRWRRSPTGSLTRGAALRKLIYPASRQSPRSGQKTYWHRPEAALWNEENLRSSTPLHLWYPHGRSAGSSTRDQHAGGPAQSETATNNEVLQHWRGELCAGMLGAGTSAAKSVEQGTKSQERHR